MRLICILLLNVYYTFASTCKKLSNTIQKLFYPIKHVIMFVPPNYKNYGKGSFTILLINKYPSCCDMWDFKASITKVPGKDLRRPNVVAAMQ